MDHEYHDGFEELLHGWARAGAPMPLGEGRQVELEACRYPRTLTAEQAVRLADRLVKLAGVGRVEMTEGGDHAL